MTKIKLLFAIFVATVILVTFSGCMHTHDHDWIAYDFEWVNGDDYQKAYMRCKTCFMRFDPNSFYEDSLTVVSYAEGVPLYGSKIWYVINVDKGKYDYNEEFDISLKITLNRRHVEQGYFYIRLSESPYYEIVGDKEQSVWFSSEEFQETYTINFRVKAIEQTDFTQRFDFKMKFNKTKAFEKEAEEDYCGKLWYYDPSDEYFYGTKQLAFMNDAGGMYLEDARRCPYLFQNSLNREYLAGKIDKDAYVKTMREYEYSDGVYTSVMLENSGEYEGTVKCIYGSPTMRVKYNLLRDGEYYSQIKNWFENGEDCHEKLAKLLVGILYEYEYISLEEYQREIKYISEMKANGELEGVSFVLIPIQGYYEEHEYTYNFVERCKATSYEPMVSVNENLAVVQLSSDRIDVSSGFDLSVYTLFGDSVKGIDIEQEK